MFYTVAKQYGYQSKNTTSFIKSAVNSLGKKNLAQQKAREEQEERDRQEAKPES